MRIKKNSKLLFIGDSITDCGRARPIGEGKDEGYGSGYVNLVRGILAADYPELQIRVINMGISGNQVPDLEARWKCDVIDLKPDWLCIMIGINDVWRQFDRPYQPETHVYLDEYKKTLDKLVSSTIKKVEGLILMTPYFIEPRKDDPMRKMMDEYGAVIEDIAKKYNTLFIDTQEVFDKITEHIPTAALAWDRVHPNIRGHMVLAKAFMKAVAD
jgi:lysophospholipase L1-like esterase